jgi:hypothetical protein
VVDLEGHVALRDDAGGRTDDPDAGPGHFDDGSLADVVLVALDGDEVPVREDDQVVGEDRQAGGGRGRGAQRGDAGRRGQDGGDGQPQAAGTGSGADAFRRCGGCRLCIGLNHRQGLLFKAGMRGDRPARPVGGAWRTASLLTAVNVEAAPVAIRCES